MEGHSQSIAITISISVETTCVFVGGGGGTLCGASPDIHHEETEHPALQTMESRRNHPWAGGGEGTSGSSVKG